VSIEGLPPALDDGLLAVFSYGEERERNSSFSSYFKNVILGQDSPQLWGLYSPTLYFCISMNSPALHFKKKEPNFIREDFTLQI
jgi:hypothetical protein